MATLPNVLLKIENRLITQMNQTDLLSFKNVICSISPITDFEWDLFEKEIHEKVIEKKHFFTKPDDICDSIGFILKGTFRTFYIDNNGEEITTHLHLENKFIVDYESFITSKHSIFYIEALENSKIFYYKKETVEKLFNLYHNWEKFGRIIAEQVFIISQKRFQSLLFQTAEQRYLGLLKEFPEIFQRVPQYLIASYLGIKPQSLSRIRKQISRQ